MVRVAQNPKLYFTVSSETPPTSRARFPYLYPQEQGGPVITPGTGLSVIGPLVVLFALHTQLRGGPNRKHRVTLLLRLDYYVVS
jgi:hypothetical protein